MNGWTDMDAGFQCFDEFPDVSLMLFSGHANRTLMLPFALTTVRLTAHPMGTAKSLPSKDGAPITKGFGELWDNIPQLGIAEAQG